MLGVVSARMLMLWQVCSMLNRKKTGMAVTANTASQMKAKMYVTMINCRSEESSALGHRNSGLRFQCDECGVFKPGINHNSLEK